MPRLKLALAIAIALVWCPMARAAVKFTIVSITTDPPGPHAPGAKLKIKLVVRNDGDTIPAGRGFEFLFTFPDGIAIAPPTGTPANYFGFCPRLTPTLLCQCFAEFPTGQTVEMEAEVTVGSNVGGPVTVTFTMRSGIVQETASVTVQIAAGPAPAPDATLVITPKVFGNIVKLGEFGDAYNLRSTNVAYVGEQIFIEVEVKNIGNAATSGQLVVVVNLLPNVWKARSPYRNGLDSICSDFVVHPSMLVATHTSNRVVPPGDSITLCFAVDLGDVPASSAGASLSGSVVAGGDVNASNNSYTVGQSSFTIFPKPQLSRFLPPPPPPAKTSGRR